MKTITKEELNKKLELHKLWFNGKVGGESLNLSGFDLSNVDLSNANLRHANLRGSNLRDSDLSYSNLSYSDLRGSNLTGSDLWSTIGNGKEIKSLQLGTYDITYTKDRLQIGCKNFSFEEWFSFTDEEIDKMDYQALDWWSEHKELLKQIVATSPAV